MGYNTVNCNSKNYYRHSIMSAAFLNLDINNVNVPIDHIDGNRINNNITNLRMVNHQQNSFNTNAKGYCWVKSRNKYKAQIYFNNKAIFLGYFTTREEAREAYLKAKLIYHII